jgi:folate-binding protein YgfZ
MPTAHLADRGVVRVQGADAKTFLDGLFTCDIDRVAPGQPRFGALLTPQGKILFDFIVFEVSQDAGGGYCLDVLKVYAPDLVKRLNFYRLRAKVMVEDASEALAVVAGWGDSLKPENSLAAQDPRLPALGWRAIVAAEDASPEPAAAGYHAHRIALGVPEGGKDFLWNDAFPHEALMDQLHGVDFDKGCYVGQEVINRIDVKGQLTKRLMGVTLLEDALPPTGAEVLVGEDVVGTITSAARVLGRPIALGVLRKSAWEPGTPVSVRAGDRVVPAVTSDLPFSES